MGRPFVTCQLNFAESASNTCPVSERYALVSLCPCAEADAMRNRGVVVEKLCEYLQYKATYEDAPRNDDIPDFTERIPPEVALEL